MEAACCVLYDLASEITYYHFSSTLLTAQVNPIHYEGFMKT